MERRSFLATALLGLMTPLASLLRVPEVKDPLFEPGTHELTGLKNRYDDIQANKMVWRHCYFTIDSDGKIETYVDGEKLEEGQAPIFSAYIGEKHD